MPPTTSRWRSPARSCVAPTTTTSTPTAPCVTKRPSCSSRRSESCPARWSACAASPEQRRRQRCRAARVPGTVPQHGARRDRQRLTHDVRDCPVHPRACAALTADRQGEPAGHLGAIARRQPMGGRRAHLGACCKIRQFAGSTESAAQSPRIEENLASRECCRTYLDQFGVNRGPSTPPLTLLQQAHSTCAHRTCARPTPRCTRALGPVPLEVGSPRRRCLRLSAGTGSRP